MSRHPVNTGVASRRHAASSRVGPQSAPPGSTVPERPEYAQALRPGDVFRLDGDTTKHVCNHVIPTRDKTVALSVEFGAVMYLGRHEMVLIRPRH